MTLDNLRKKVATATDKVINLTLRSSQEITEAIKEYKEAVEIPQSLWLDGGQDSRGRQSPSGDHTTIKGSFSDLDEKRLNELLETKKDQKLLTAILSALVMVTKLRDVVDLAGLRNIVIEIALGIPPRIIVDIE